MSALRSGACPTQIAATILVAALGFHAASAQQTDEPKGPGAEQATLSAIRDAQSAKRRRGADFATADKLDSALRRLWEQYASGLQPGQERQAATARPGARPFPFPRLDGENLVQVYVHLSDTRQTTIDELTTAGLVLEVVNADLGQAQGWIAVDRLAQLADFDYVERVTVPRYGFSRSGSVTTEGDAILRARQLRAMGFAGRGVKVGVISDGATDWIASRSSGDLPARGITTYGTCTKRPADPENCSREWTCNEGTAMAEIIHDVAPEADIAVGAASTTLEFVQRVNQLVNTFKADIVVDDIGFLGEPMFEDGDVAAAVNALADQALFVSAAGNSASGHYERQYYPGPGSTLHDFGRAVGTVSDLGNRVVVPGNSAILVILQWNDRHGASRNDYDVYLRDADSNLLADSSDPQDGIGSDPLEGFCYYNSRSNDQAAWVVIDKYSGQARRLEMLMNTSGTKEYNDPQGSIFGHPGLPSVIAVGAINANDSGHDNIAFYSSRGPSRIDFPYLQERRKPDLAAIDGVSISGVGGFSSPFYGTSAAAPHVAGIAAQLMSVSSLATGARVRKALEAGAVDLGAAGFDSVFGHGRVDALNARSMLRLVFNPAPFILLLDED